LLHGHEDTSLEPRVRASVDRTPVELPGSLGDLRCCLFFEQRRWRHYGYGFDEETQRYARELVGAMGGVLVDRQSYG
jgi:hypothetical protein